MNDPRSLLPHPQDEFSPAARRAGAPSRFGRRRRTLRPGGKPGARSAGTGPRAEAGARAGGYNSARISKIPCGHPSACAGVSTIPARSRARQPRRNAHRGAPRYRHWLGGRGRLPGREGWASAALAGPNHHGRASGCDLPILARLRRLHLQPRSGRQADAGAAARYLEDGAQDVLGLLALLMRSMPAASAARLPLGTCRGEAGGAQCNG